MHIATSEESCGVEVSSNSTCGIYSKSYETTITRLPLHVLQILFHRENADEVVYTLRRAIRTSLSNHSIRTRACRHTSTKSSVGGPVQSAWGLWSGLYAFRSRNETCQGLPKQRVPVCVHMPCDESSGVHLVTICKHEEEARWWRWWKENLIRSERSWTTGDASLARNVF